MEGPCEGGEPVAQALGEGRRVGLFSTIEGACLSPRLRVVQVTFLLALLSTPVTPFLLQRRNFTLAFQAAESVGIKSTLVSPLPRGLLQLGRASFFLVETLGGGVASEVAAGPVTHGWCADR